MDAEEWRMVVLEMGWVHEDEEDPALLVSDAEKERGV